MSIGVQVAQGCGSTPIVQEYWFRNRFCITICLESLLCQLKNVSSNATSVCGVSLGFQFCDVEISQATGDGELPYPFHSKLVEFFQSQFTAGARLSTRNLCLRCSIRWDTSSNLLKPISELQGPVSHFGLSFHLAPRLGSFYLKHLRISLLLLSWLKSFIFLK